MQIHNNYLIISNKVNSLLQLLFTLSEFEYKQDSKVDILLKENYSEKDIKRLISCFAYLAQINYSNHCFRLFISDKKTYTLFKESQTKLGLERNIQIYKFVEALASGIIEMEGMLLNKYIYRAIINIKEDKIETFYNIDKFNEKISIK